MPHFHVRVLWSEENDWSGWVEAHDRCTAIALLVKAITVNQDIAVPDTAEITVRQGDPNTR